MSNTFITTLWFCIAITVLVLVPHDDAPAATRFGLACILNNTNEPIGFSYQWDNVRPESIVIPPHVTLPFFWSFRENENRGPLLNITYDAMLGLEKYPASRTARVDASPDHDCESRDPNNVFEYDTPNTIELHTIELRSYE